MRIVTTLDHTPSGRPVIRARGMDMQRSTNYNHGLSHDANHGIAAANLILAKSASMHPLTQQNGDNLAVAAVRSIDSGASTHETVNGARHVFNV